MATPTAETASRAFPAQSWASSGIWLESLKVPPCSLLSETPQLFQQYQGTHSLTDCCFSVAKLYSTLWDPMDCSTPGFPVLHYLLEFVQTLVHWVSDAIQPSHPLSPSSPLALNLSQHQSLFQWVGSSYQVAKVLKFQLHHQSFQWIFRVDFL